MSSTVNSQEKQIKEKIQTLFSDAKVSIAGENCSFSIQVISNQFEGLNLLTRQRKIMALFQDQISSGEIHALSLKTHTEDEFKKIS